MKFPYYDTEGKPIYIFGISENITEYKETFEDLKKRNEFIEKIIGNLPIGIMVIDFNDESLMYANSVAENIFGSEKTDISSVDKLLLRLFPIKELRIAEKIAFVKSIFDEKPTNHIWENIELSGTKKTITLLNIPLPNQGIIISIVNDISQKISNEQLLLDSKNTNAAFLKAVPDMIFICDRQDVIIDFKPGINNNTFVSPDQFIGKPVENVLPEEVSKLIKKNSEKVFSTNIAQVIEYQLLMDDLVCDYEGRMVKYGEDKVMIIIRDITAKKDAERALTQSEQDLRELNKAKDKLFSIISHDLRNPISAFLGLTQIIYESAFEMPRVEIKEILSALNSSANNVYQLLQNMLYWSQLNNGKIQYSPEIIDLCSLTTGYKSIIAANATEKNITIEIDIQDKCLVLADSNMLTSAVLNLLSNAVKFTDPGGRVKLAVSQNGKITTISVEDNGQGMSEKDVDTILYSDNSITTAGTYKEKGVGLGLVVTREFVAMHKDKHGAGEFFAESQLGKGSKFSFTLLNAAD